MVSTGLGAMLSTKDTSTQPEVSISVTKPAPARARSSSSIPCAARGSPPVRVTFLIPLSRAFAVISAAVMGVWGLSKDRAYAVSQ